MLYIFTSSSAPDREVSQLRETFSPKSPFRMTSVTFGWKKDSVLSGAMNLKDTYELLRLLGSCTLHSDLL